MLVAAGCNSRSSFTTMQADTLGIVMGAMMHE